MRNTDHTSSQEEAEEEEEKEKAGKADIKSNNPHLTGGEKRNQRSGVPKQTFELQVSRTTSLTYTMVPADRCTSSGDVKEMSSLTQAPSLVISSLGKMCLMLT